MTADQPTGQDDIFRQQQQAGNWMRQFFLVPCLYSLLCLVFLPVGYHTFHFFAELGAVTIGLMAMTTAGVSYRFLQNNFLVIVAIGLGWSAILDIGHIAAYEGMNLLTLASADPASQLWLIARFLQAMAFLCGVLLASRPVQPAVVHSIMVLYCLLMLALLVTGHFPDTFLPESGLTVFKIAAEVVIIAIFVTTAVLLTLRRQLFTRDTYLKIMLAIITMVMAELCFMAYLSVSDFFNAAGHILKIFSYWFVFRVLVLATIQTPFRDRERLIGDLRERVKELRMLYDLSVDTESPALDQSTLLKHTVERLPGAFLFPELALAAVTSRWGNYGNPRLIAADRKIEMELEVDGEKVATLFVGYPESAPVAEPFFLKEEYTLMNMVGSKVEDVLTRIANQQRIDQLSRLYVTLSATNRAIVQSRDPTALFEALGTVLAAGNISPTAFIADMAGGVRGEAVVLRYARGLDDEQTGKLKTLLDDLQRSGPWQRATAHQPILLPSRLAELGLAGEAPGGGEGLRPVLMPLVVRDRVASVVGFLVKDELELAGDYWRLLNEMQSDLEFALNGFEQVEQRLRAETLAQESEQRFQLIFERSPVPLIMLGLREEHQDFANKAFYDLLGLAPGDAMSPMAFLDRFLVERDRVDEVKENFRAALERIKSMDTVIDLPEITVRHNSGHLVYIWASMIRIGDEVLLVLHDRTATRINEQKLRENEARFRGMVEQINLPISVCRDGVMLYTNPYLNAMLGKPAEEVVGMALRDIYHPMPGDGDDKPGWGPAPNEPARQHDVLIETASGEEIVLNVQVSNIPWEDDRAYISVGEDVTQKRRVERALQRSHELLNDLSEQIPGVIYQFRMFPDGRACFPFASARIWDIYEVTPEQVKEDAGPVFERLHPDDRESVERSIAESAASLGIWRADYRVVLPEKGVRWRSGFASPEKQEDGSVLWHGFIEDSTERMNTQEELDRYNRELEASMKGTLEVVARMVDLRDPYTAGHERRVALIAAAIGKDVGLTERQVENLRLAGMVHDIGKIAIPAEILSKPSRLTASEYELIKGHAQAGYDILKDVRLPPVIGECIWQHHERLDGSGYPRGLKGGEIIREARILAVADVLESMASHRPYRPALGVEVALEELQKNAGTLYDADIVAAITRLVEAGELDINTL